MTRACAGSTYIPGAVQANPIGLPFAPQGVIWWLNYVGAGMAERTVQKNVQPNLGVFGWSTPGYSWSTGWRVEENAPTTAAKRRSEAGSGAGYVIPNGTGSAATFAGVVSVTATGILVNATTAAAGAPLLFGYVAFAELSGVKAGTFTIDAGTGSTPVTGVGFQPDALLLGTAWQTAATYNGAVAHSLGMADAGSMYGLHRRVADLAAAADTWGSAKSTAVLHRQTTAGVEEAIVTRTSLDADGFTLNRTTNTLGASNPGYYLALKGDVRVEQIATTGSRRTETGMGTPQAGLLLGNRLVPDAGAAHDRQGMGVFDSGGNQAAGAAYSPDTSDPSLVHVGNTRRYGMGTIAGTADNDVSAGRITVLRDAFVVDSAGPFSTGEWGMLLFGTDRFVRGDVVGS